MRAFNVSHNIQMDIVNSLTIGYNQQVYILHGKMSYILC
jgi:hypothetical protein